MKQRLRYVKAADIDTKWSLSRGLGYFFGNRDVYEELTRLRGESFELRERLLEKHHVRGLARAEDKIETQAAPPEPGFDEWKESREAELVEVQALDAVKDEALLEQFTYFAEVDPELWNPVLLRAEGIKAEMRAGTYREPQER